MTRLHFPNLTKLSLDVRQGFDGGSCDGLMFVAAKLEDLTLSGCVAPSVVDVFDTSMMAMPYLKSITTSFECAYSMRSGAVEFCVKAIANCRNLMPRITTWIVRYESEVILPALLRHLTVVRHAVLPGQSSAVFQPRSIEYSGPEPLDEAPETWNAVCSLKSVKELRVDLSVQALTPTLPANLDRLAIILDEVDKPATINVYEVIDMLKRRNGTVSISVPCTHRFAYGFPRGFDAARHWIAEASDWIRAGADILPLYEKPGEGLFFGAAIRFLKQTWLREVYEEARGINRRNYLGNLTPNFGSPEDSDSENESIDWESDWDSNKSFARRADLSDDSDSFDWGHFDSSDSDRTRLGGRRRR